MKLVRLFLIIALAPSMAMSQSVALPFSPAVNGFPFPNYRNDHRWQDDIGTEDVIRMFGARAACKTGTTAANCVLKEAASAWIAKYLKAMEIGHCEGIGVASLRMFANQPFKSRRAPAAFQQGARVPFDVRLAQPMENYIAYYWITQTFDEVVKPTRALAARGPIAIAGIVRDSIRDRNETYLLGIKKTPNGSRAEGHAVTPFAVDESPTEFRISVYDNNYPGQTRYLTVLKNAAQTWSYNGTRNANGKPDFVGDRTTMTLEATATSWREGRCFDSSFARDFDRETGCGIESASLFNGGTLVNAAFSPAFDADGESAEFFLTGEGEMLVTAPDGRRIGFDPGTGRYVNEIPGSELDSLKGGLGDDAPHFSVPYELSEENYEIVFSGRYLDSENYIDFVFSAPGFTVGFSDIRLDPGETLEATISADGEEISFMASKDGETPEVFYAFDPLDEEDAASYYTLIGGVELVAGKALFYNFDFENGKLLFSDDDGNADEYDIELVRLLPDGTRQTYRNEDLRFGKGDRYEMDFADWDGSDEMCFKEDDEGNGFADEQCVEEDNEAN